MVSSKKWDIHIKKTLYPKAQNRPDVQEKCKEWKLNQVTIEVNKLVFIDESSINLGMTRLYGRALTYERIVDYAPDVRFQRLSILSAVRLDGTHIPMFFSGTLNGQLFVKYVEKFLAPLFLKGDIVIMDNLISAQSRRCSRADSGKRCKHFILTCKKVNLKTGTALTCE